jgi:predicted NBD/HSP70 family sugar kinase
MIMYIVADIGGTKMRIAKSDDLKSFSEPIILDTPQEYAVGIESFREAAHELTGPSAKIDGIAVGIAGPLSADKRSVFKTPHLHWDGRPIADDMENAFGTKAFIENDVALVGLGEAVAGAGVSSSIVAYVTVSTGVNGVRIVDGKIDRTAEGFEIGGQYMTVEEPRLTLEDMVSGTAVQKAFNMKPKDLGADNPVWEELAQIFAYGLHNTIVHWSPNRVVLGGSMFNDIGISVPSVEKHVKEIMKKFPVVPEIMHSKLGDVGGLHGGLELLRQKNGHA